MAENYSYPMDFSWSKEEIIAVVELFSSVELAYTNGILKQEFMKKYLAFKKVVPSIGEEKRLGKEFEDASGFSLYRVVQFAKTIEDSKKIKVKT